MERWEEPARLPERNADGLPPVAWTEEQKYLFDTRGWLLVPGVLSEAEVAEMQAFCYRLKREPESLPPAGAPVLRGAAASHAWFAVFVPGIGWVDFDPTDDQIVSNHHVTTAWGRDYADVAPLRGVVFGGGSHTLEVEVDVIKENTGHGTQNTDP